jgi:hypothetical protein
VFAKLFPERDTLHYLIIKKAVYAENTDLLSDLELLICWMDYGYFYKIDKEVPCDYLLAAVIPVSILAVTVESERSDCVSQILRLLSGPSAINPTEVINVLEWLANAVKTTASLESSLVARAVQCCVAQLSSIPDGILALRLSLEITESLNGGDRRVLCSEILRCLDRGQSACYKIS